MSTKSSIAYPDFAPGSSRGARSRHTVLAEMAREAKELADQAERLKGLRKLARVSQVTAANAIGVTPRAYQAWEAGGDLSPDNRQKAATYFGTTSDYIEFGVMNRRAERGATPDLSRRDTLADIRERLDVIDETLRTLAQAHAMTHEALRALGQERPSDIERISPPPALARLLQADPPTPATNQPEQPPPAEDMRRSADG